MGRAVLPLKASGENPSCLFQLLVTPGDTWLQSSASVFIGPFSYPVSVVVVGFFPPVSYKDAVLQG